MDVSIVDESTVLVSSHDIPKDARKPYQRQLAVYLVLASTLFERIAFYTLVANLTATLQLPDFLNWNPSNSVIASNIFSGISNVSSLIFAVITDAKLGRAKTIIVGFFLYLIGYIFVTLIPSLDTSICGNYTSSKSISALNTTTLSQEYCANQMLGALVIIAVGAGAVQANMAVFGAEQIQESKRPSRYFDKYVIAINIGAMLAILVIPLGSIKEKTISTEYTIATSILFIAALLFVIGSLYYIHVEPYDSVIVNCIPVIINAFQSWRQFKQNKYFIGQDDSTSFSSNVSHASHSCTEEGQPTTINEQSFSFLDFAKATNHGKFQDRIVDDVRSLRSVLIVFSLLIPYWLLYNQMYATFPLQGKCMKGSGKNQIVATRMWLGDPVTIIFGLLIFNVYVYKYLDGVGRSLTIANKFVIGMCFACIAMLIAGTIEKFRLKSCNSSKNESTVSIYFQLLENIFMGFSEIFAMVASYEFAYFAAPRSAQSLFMSIRFCSIGIPSFVNTAYIALFTTSSSRLDFSCQFDSNRQWTFYSYFYILAILQFIFIIIFIVCQKKFQIIKYDPEQMKTKQFLREPSISSSG